MTTKELKNCIAFQLEAINARAPWGEGKRVTLARRYNYYAIDLIEEATTGADTLRTGLTLKEAAAYVRGMFDITTARK